MDLNAESLISFLGLEKHPEGGYYKEIYKTIDKISDKELTVNFTGERHLATSIYFLLKSGEVSRFHRLISDEIWYFHAGDPLTIHVINKKGDLNNYKLGLNVEKGEKPQIIIPKGDIFGATIEAGNKFCLVGCMVSPGFDFADFELMSMEKMIKAYPQHEDMIRLLT